MACLGWLGTMLGSGNSYFIARHDKEGKCLAYSGKDSCATFSLLQQEGEEMEAGLGCVDDIPGRKEETKYTPLLPFCHLSAL